MKRWSVRALFLLGLWATPTFALTECEIQCWAVYDTCGCADYWSCAMCDEQRDDCLDYCAQYPCPSTRDYTVNTVLSQQFTGATQCLQDITAANRGLTFWEYFVRYRETNYRETTACNGTKTTMVLSTADRQTHCLRETTFTCSPYQSPTLFNICAF